MLWHHQLVIGVQREPTADYSVDKSRECRMIIYLETWQVLPAEWVTQYFTTHTHPIHSRGGGIGAPGDCPSMAFIFYLFGDWEMPKWNLQGAIFSFSYCGAMMVRICAMSANMTDNLNAKNLNNIFNTIFWTQQPNRLHVWHLNSPLHSFDHLFVGPILKYTNLSQSVYNYYELP